MSHTPRFVEDWDEHENHVLCELLYEGYNNEDIAKEFHRRIDVKSRTETAVRGHLAKLRVCPRWELTRRPGYKARASGRRKGSAEQPPPRTPFLDKDGNEIKWKREWIRKDIYAPGKTPEKKAAARIHRPVRPRNTHAVVDYELLEMNNDVLFSMEEGSWYYNPATLQFIRKVREAAYPNETPPQEGSDSDSDSDHGIPFQENPEEDRPSGLEIATQIVQETIADGRQFLCATRNDDDDDATWLEYDVVNQPPQQANPPTDPSEMKYTIQSQVEAVPFALYIIGCKYREVPGFGWNPTGPNNQNRHHLPQATRIDSPPPIEIARATLPSTMEELLSELAKKDPCVNEQLRGGAYAMHVKKYMKCRESDWRNVVKYDSWYNFNEGCYCFEWTKDYKFTEDIPWGDDTHSVLDDPISTLFVHTPKEDKEILARLEKCEMFWGDFNPAMRMFLGIMKHIYLDRYEFLTGAHTDFVRDALLPQFLEKIANNFQKLGIK